MKIVSLNVNNFGGAKEEKPRWDKCKKEGLSWQEYKDKRKAFQESDDRITKAEAIAKRLNPLDPDIIVLSEFDIAAPAGKEFIKRFADYELILPISKTHSGKVLENAGDYGPGYSITVILIKKELCGEGILRRTAPGGWADFNLVKLDNLTILGIHAKEGNFDEFKKWVMKATSDTEKILIIGDFNTYEENNACQKTRDSYREILKLGYTDLCPKGVPTYIWGTCIDHALCSSSLADKYRPLENPEKPVDNSFFREGLSDHAAVIIDLNL